MRYFLLCIALLASLSATHAIGSELLATGSLKQAVYELPNDSGKMYLTVVGNKQDQKFNDLCGLFSTTPEWTELRDSTHYTQLATNSTMYKSRYAKDYTDFPTVRLQTADGAIVNEWVGRGIPASDQLMSALKAECFRRHRQSAPAPMHDECDDQIKQRIDSVDTPPLGGEWPEWYWIAVAVLCGSALSVRDEWKSKQVA